MADQNTVEVRIGANVEGARRGAQEASAAVDGILAKLKEFKHEAVSTGREARFFAMELAEMVPGAEGAKGALRDLIAIGLSGSAFEGLIGGVRLAVRAFESFTETQKKAKEELKKFAEESATYIQKVNDQITSMLVNASEATAAQKQRELELGPLLVKNSQLTENYEKAKRALAEATGEVYTEEGQQARNTATEAEAVASAFARLQQNTAAIINLSAKGGVGLGVEAAQQAAKDQEEAQKRAIDAMLADATRWQQEKKKKYDDDTQAATVGLQKWLVAQDKAEGEAFAAFKKDQDDRLKYKLEIDKLLQEQEKKIAEQVAADAKRTAQDFIRPVEAAFNSAIRSMIRGAQDFDVVMRELMLGLVDAVIAGFIKMVGQEIVQAITGAAVTRAKSIEQVTQAAGVAGAEAAASAAMIPGIGPFVAVGAGEAMAAAVLASFIPMASARGGWDVPSGGPFPAILHEREMVLPAPLADNVREGGLGGGIELHFHGPVYDAGGLRQIARHPDFIKGMREARRTGQLP